MGSFYKHCSLRQEVDHLLQQFEGTIETGFQLATFKGPLCAEPVEGMAYFVESIEVDEKGVGEVESCELSFFVFYILFFSGGEDFFRKRRVVGSRCSVYTVYAITYTLSCYEQYMCYVLDTSIRLSILLYF